MRPLLKLLPVDLGPGVVAGFTRREGGVSQDRWEGLNLALHVGDDARRVERNRRKLEDAVGVPVHFVDQVHGTDVHVVVSPAAPGEEAPVPVADVVLAAGSGVGVAVMVADCVPVLLVDPVAGVGAAVHAGRAGLLGGVLQSAVTELEACGAQPSRIRAALGPAAGACCYEVPEAMREDAASRIPAARGTTRKGTPSIDLRGGCQAVLQDLGVASVQVVGGCTLEDPSSYSYRRDGVTGRFAGVLVTA